MSKITKNSCRTCLINDGTVSIFEKLVDNEQFSDILMACTNLKIIPNDGFLDTICYKCIENLIIAHNFKKECLESNHKMRMFFLKSALLKKNENLIPQEKDKNKHQIKTKETFKKFRSVNNEIEVKSNIVNVNVNREKSISVEKSTNDLNFSSYLNDHAYLKSNIKQEIDNEDIKYEEIETLDYDLKEFFNEVSTNSNKILNLLVEKVEFDEIINDNASSETAHQKLFNSNSSSKNIIEEKSHKKLNRQRNYKCNICKKMYLEDCHLKAHLNKIHKLKCLKCGLIFDNKKECDLHSKTHSKNVLQCDICMKTFKLQKSIQNHYRISHLNDVSYICEVCGMGFSSNCTLKTHNKNVHLGIKPYKCNICPQAYAYKNLLIAHMNNHNNIKPHKCNVCDRRFNIYRNLTNHLRIHTGDYKYKCPVCEKKIPTPGHLRVHMRIHTGEMPYECKDCGKKYNHQGGYAIHLRIHTGETPYKCSSCDKAFRDTKSRSRHELVHTNERPFGCNLCDYKCKHPSNLKSHMKVHLRVK